MSNVATPDIVLAIVILLSAVLGLARGLVKEVLSLVIWGAALVAALVLGDVVGEQFGDSLGDAVGGLAGFAAVFVAVLIAGAVVQWLFARMIESTGLSGTDRFLGFLFGSARGIVVCTVALIAMRPFMEEAQWWQESRLRPELAKMEESVLAIMGQTRALIVPRGGPESPAGGPT